MMVGAPCITPWIFAEEYPVEIWLPVRLIGIEFAESFLVTYGCPSRSVWTWGSMGLSECPYPPPQAHCPCHRRQLFAIVQFCVRWVRLFVVIYTFLLERESRYKSRIRDFHPELLNNPFPFTQLQIFRRIRICFSSSGSGSWSAIAAMQHVSTRSIQSRLSACLKKDTITSWIVAVTVMHSFRSQYNVISVTYFLRPFFSNTTYSNISCHTSTEFYLQ